MSSRGLVVVALALALGACGGAVPIPAPDTGSVAVASPRSVSSSRPLRITSHSTEGPML